MARARLIDFLDLSQFEETPSTTSPGFADLTNTELGDNLTDADGFDTEMSDVIGLVDALDAASAALDADLDTILALLDAADTGATDKALTDYAAVQPTSESLLGDTTGLDVPALRPLALVQPSGAASVTFGGPPEQGGVVTAGAPAYVRHLPLVPAGAGISNVDADGGTGPNPPFAGWGPVVKETGADGKVYWTYLVSINPAQAGTFTGVAQYLVALTITGITGTVTRTLPFQVVVEPGAGGAGGPQPTGPPAPPAPAPPPRQLPPPPGPGRLGL